MRRGVGIAGAVQSLGHYKLSPMCSRCMLLKWAVFVGLCTLVVFFFPAHSGPFTAMYGPVTALRGWQAAAAVFAGIIVAAASIVVVLLSGLSARYRYGGQPEPHFLHGALESSACSPLRC